jgi:hypothetical protein
MHDSGTMAVGPDGEKKVLSLAKGNVRVLGTHLPKVRKNWHTEITRENLSRGMGVTGYLSFWHSSFRQRYLVTDKGEEAARCGLRAVPARCRYDAMFNDS